MDERLLSVAKKIIHKVIAISFMAMICVPAYALDMLPHRVTYQLSLLESDKDSGVRDIKGRTVFTLQRECEGWKSGEDYVMQMIFDGGNELYLASLFESFEDEAGELFSFSIDEQSTYEAPLSFDGYATTNADEGQGNAYFSIEPDAPLTLPDKTYFPVEHTFQILKRAKKGETFFNAHIFFGAKPDEALKKTNVIIGKKQKADEAKVQSELLETDYYPVNVAYFEPSTVTGLPTYEILFHMQDNGIVTYYQIDYGDFKLSANLDDIQKEAIPTCK